MPEHRAHLGMIPEHMHRSICRWIEQGEPKPHLMGRFLRAILSNDLRETVATADDENARHLVAWVRFLWNHAPGACWGSVQALEAWYDRCHPEGRPKENDR